MKRCTSCKKEADTDYIEFKCPECGKARIIRCLNCRTNSRVYKCPECKFEGP